jgi:translation initiation factor 2 beta subunit (eIF-2beta)/eIF-5
VKVPNPDRAVVDIRKLTDYCLSHEHPRGKHKARVFLSALGMTGAHAGELRDALLKKVMSEECVVGTVDEYGARYIVDFTFARGDREAMVRSTWIMKAGEQTPRLTSCFVL